MVGCALSGSGPGHCREFLPGNGELIPAARRTMGRLRNGRLPGMGRNDRPKLDGSEYLRHQYRRCGPGQLHAESPPRSGRDLDRENRRKLAAGHHLRRHLHWDDIRRERGHADPHRTGFSGFRLCRHSDDAAGNRDPDQPGFLRLYPYAELHLRRKGRDHRRQHRRENQLGAAGPERLLQQCRKRGMHPDLRDL